MLRPFLSLAILSLVWSPALPMALEPGTHARTFFSKQDGTEQPYNLYVPTAAEAGEPLPLVVALHGYGATWESWFIATDVEEWAEKEGYIVLCPQGRGNWYYLGKGEKDVFEAMAAVKKELSVDPDRTYLIGHSMGGWGTWHTAVAHPDVFAAIVPMAGWAPPELIGNLEYTAPLVIHGDQDEAVGVEHSRSAVSTLAMRGISHRYIEVRGAGHESSLINDMLPTIGDWIRGVAREKAPAEIRLSARIPTRGKAWWLSIRKIEPITQLVAEQGNETKERMLLRQGNITADWDGQTGKLSISTNQIREFSVDLSQAPLADFKGERIEITIDADKLTASTGGKNLLFNWEQRRKNTDLSGKAAFSMQNEGAPVWQVQSISEDGLEPVTDPVIGKVTTPAEKMYQRLGDIICDGDSSQSVLLLCDNFFVPEPPEGELTLGELVDWYARNDDRLLTYLATWAELQQALENQEDWKPSWWAEVKAYPERGNVDPDESMNILVPADLADRIRSALPPKASMVQTMWRPGIRDSLYSHVMRTGEL